MKLAVACARVATIENDLAVRSSIVALAVEISAASDIIVDHKDSTMKVVFEVSCANLSYRCYRAAIVAFVTHLSVEIAVSISYCY